MPSRLVDDPKHWRDRATEMRGLLDAITDFDMKSKALELADDYDTLAGRAEDRAGGATVRNKGVAPSAAGVHSLCSMSTSAKSIQTK
jgi:hypothetical protein